MIFVSKSGAYKITIRPAIGEYHPSTGVRIGQKPAILAQFRQGGCPEWIRDVAVQRFSFTGLGEQTDPRSRVSYFDTDDEALIQGWTEEEKDLVEQVMLRNMSEHYTTIDRPRLSEPWPGYRKMKGGKGPGNSLGDKIVAFLTATEQDPEAVLAFELECFDGGRPQVVEALRVHIALKDRAAFDQETALDQEEMVRA